MKWKKMGKVFDPSRASLPDHCTEYAQSPQALVFEDFVRIYFSCREKDATGQYLSHISFVEMDKGLKGITRYAGKTVIPLGDLGCFDEHGIFPMNMLRRQDEVWGYTCGWSRRKSVGVETSIGLAKSTDDGLTFQRCGPGPILTASLHEPFLVGDPFVKVVQDRFHMWYIFGTSWSHQPSEKTPARVYKIGHAISDDGVSWEREGRQIIESRLNADESQALPTVFFHENRYHMLFCYREATDFRQNRLRGYRIGYAYSDDLATWTRDDQQAGIDVSPSGWDSQMICYPHVFQLAGKVYLLYNGNEFGRHGFGLAVMETPEAQITAGETESQTP